MITETLPGPGVALVSLAAASVSCDVAGRVADYHPPNDEPSFPKGGEKGTGGALVLGVSAWSGLG